MYFKHFYDPDLAQGSYLIGCQKAGEAIVVDPRRDIAVYIQEAKAQGLTIRHVTETHIHADYLSGSRELAYATGATLYLSAEGDDDWQYRFTDEDAAKTPFTKLHDGDTIALGNITIQALHTPGHTPEHLAFLVTDGAQSDQPGYLLSGDFIFVGDVGRPDLLDEAAGGQDTRFVGAKQLFQSLQNVFMPLADYIQVWPGHGAGSACGKALGAVPSTTVGYEKQVAWWATYVKNNDEKGFVDELLNAQPDAPAYFGRMKRQNKAGPALLKDAPALTHHKPRDIAKDINKDILFIDTRKPDVYKTQGVAESLNIPFGNSFATFSSYVIDPERDTRPIVALANDADHANTLRNRLRYVGIDTMAGYVTDTAGLPTHTVHQLSPQDLKKRQKVDDYADNTDDTPFVLDVRTKNEYSDGHIPGSHQLHAGRVMWNLDALPKDTPLVTLCQSGMRNTAVASALRAAGFDNVLELAGSYAHWKETFGDSPQDIATGLEPQDILTSS